MFISNKDPGYNAWRSMRQRCNNPRRTYYSNYGGRGIKVCEAWDSYEQFIADMGPHPGPGWTLDRKDGDKDYTPDNCRWATRKTQARNRRCSIGQELADKIRAEY